jgi:D-amino-acid dehydrogenase
MRAIEATLAGTSYGGCFTECDSTGEIHKFTQGLAMAIEGLGVRCLYGEDVQAVATDGKRATVTGSTSTRSRATRSPST